MKTTHTQLKQLIFIVLIALLSTIWKHSAHAQAPAPSRLSNDNEFRYLSSSGLPNHKIGKFPNKNSPYRIKQHNRKFTIPLKPQRATNPTFIPQNMYFGVALNGIPLHPISDFAWKKDPIWRYEPFSKTAPTGFDSHNGDVTAQNAYVYRGIPTPLMNKPFTHIGYAADGFPVFVSKDQRYKSSYVLQKGTRTGSNRSPGGSYDGTFASDYRFKQGHGNLDRCNGILINNTYYIYIVTEEFPHIPRCWSGTPHKSFTTTIATKAPRRSSSGLKINKTPNADGRVEDKKNKRLLRPGRNQ